jgi:hypothetical protein
MGSPVTQVAEQELLVVAMLATELADLAVGTLPWIRPGVFGLLFGQMNAARMDYCFWKQLST